MPRLLPTLLLLSLPLPAVAAERITLRSGFSIDCLRHETTGDHTRLILPGNSAAPDTSYMEVPSAAILHIETGIPIPTATPPETLSSQPQRSEGVEPASPPHAVLSAADMHPLLAHAGAAHHIDEDLLASVVRAESHGAVHALSHTGARGLMQLMPATAATLGVVDSFAPDQNINGGTAYLDQLLTRYHDNIALAVAAYNAGPAAVDRFHGVPPFSETRAYVRRVIAEFNRRKLAAQAALSSSPKPREGALAASVAPVLR